MSRCEDCGEPHGLGCLLSCPQRDDAIARDFKAQYPDATPAKTRAFGKKGGEQR